MTGHPGVAAPPITIGPFRLVDVRGHQDHGERLLRGARVADHPYRVAAATGRVWPQPYGMIIVDGFVGPRRLDAMALAHVFSALGPIDPNRHTYNLLHYATDGWRRPKSNRGSAPNPSSQHPKTSPSDLAPSQTQRPLSEPCTTRTEGRP